MAPTYHVAPHGDDSQSGTPDAPWRTINHAAAAAQAGDTVFIRGGDYPLAEQIRVANAGRAGAWITFAAYPGETPVIDARDMMITIKQVGRYVNPAQESAFQVQDVAYIRLHGLTLRNSHSAGVMVRDCHQVDVLNLTVEDTFASGIGVWKTDGTENVCQHIRVIGNTVIGANTFRLALPPFRNRREPPHEAISIAGAQHFEVAYNHVHHCEKEGIDVKETSCDGVVHHNYVHHVWRQGLYADAWFGPIERVTFRDNVVHDCGSAGIALSTENGQIVTDVDIHHNLVFNNQGAGIYFSRWGHDGPRARIQVHHNTVHHNGYGEPRAGEAYFWLTGGLYLFSANLRDITIEDNIFSDNHAFATGYSDHWLRGAENGADITAILAARGIRLARNLVTGPPPPAYPIQVGYTGTDHAAQVWAVPDASALSGDPAYVNPAHADFRPGPDSAALIANADQPLGALRPDQPHDPWWAHDFPPVVRFD